MAFRQSFLTAKTGDPAFVAFLAFYVACIAVTCAVYLRPAPATSRTRGRPTRESERRTRHGDTADANRRHRAAATMAWSAAVPRPGHVGLAVTTRVAEPGTGSLPRLQNGRA